jgi:glycine/D-amino acid oxidase-like deaminating enzyme
MWDSIWFETISDDDRALLQTSDPAPAAAEVLILGAGLIGLATAYYLCEAGVSDIVVLDRHPPLSGASGANAGGLWFAQQSPELGPLVPLAHASSRLYDDLPSALGVDIDLHRCGLLQLLDGPRDPVAAVRQNGFRARLLAPDEVQSLEPALASAPHGAVFYPDEGQVNPVKLGVALIRRLRVQGVRIAFLQNEPNFGVKVITSGAWTPQVTAALGWTPPIRPLRGQLLATAPLPATLRHTILGPRFYYWQLVQGHVAGGGTVEDVGFTPGTDPTDLGAIRVEMNSLFPALASVPTACAWSGFRPFCEDLRPVIGRVPGRDRVFVAAGHFKKGVMLAPVTGKILADLITTGCTDLPIDAVNPARFP